MTDSRSREKPTLSEQQAEWERAYDEAMQWRDWQTCDYLLDEREQAEWWEERDAPDEDFYIRDVQRDEV